MRVFARGGTPQGERNNMNKDLTTGSVWGNIIRFSLPYLLSYFLQTLYGMADLYIIGQFDPVASTTSVAVGSQVMHMLTVMLVGLAMGSTVSIGQSIGKGDRKKAALDLGNTITIFMLLSLVLTAVLLALRGAIVNVMSTPTEAVDGAVKYLTVCFIGIPFITAYNIIASIFRGLGDSKSPMYFIAIACVTNIALDYLFMGVFRLGPVGAALGTTISQAISVIVSLIAVMKRDTGIRLKSSDFHPVKQIVAQIMRIGLPVMLQDGFIQVSFIIITIIANKRGLIDSAAVGIVEKIIGIFFLIPSSMLSTVSALGAQNIGAGKRDRAIETLKYGVLIAASIGFTLSIITQFMAEPIVSLFTDKTDGAEVIIRGGQYLRGYVWDCSFAGVQFSFSGYFCAVGRSELSFMHNTISILTTRIPGAYLTSKYFPQTLFPMGLASAAGSLVSCIVCFIAFAATEKRKEKL